jgi:leader peptidase (prepilin peptidase)/N-methyltransferase
MVEKIIIIILGMAWGSFLNVVIFRLPRRMSLMHPPSTCPQCRQRIKFYHNIPVFSYVLLGGKCRYCRAKIPISYFLVEMITPLSFLLLYEFYGLATFFFASCVFASAMIALGFIDFFHQILPDAITLPGAALALGYAFFREDMTFLQSLLGLAVGAGFLLFIYGAYYLLRKKEGLGMGDITMMLLIGAFLGWKLTIFTLITASTLGALVGAFFIFYRKKDLQFALPFGTFLALAAFFSLIWGERIITAYLNLFKTP